MRKIILRLLEKTSWWNRLVECDITKQQAEWYLSMANVYSSIETTREDYLCKYIETINEFNSIKFWWMKSL